jgi:hypothetical protein
VDDVVTFYLSGVAYRPQDREPHATWRMPDDVVPLRVNFSHTRAPIGNAALMRDKDGVVHARARVFGPGAAGLLKLYPVFAVGVVSPFDASRARIVGVSIVFANEDPRVGPYSVRETEET